MKNFWFTIFTVFLFSQAMSQSAYKWKLHVGGGAMMYKGDVGKSYGKKQPSLHLALERRFAYGVAAQLGFDKGAITGNDRLNAAGKLAKDNPNFDRALNFRTKMSSAYIKLVYYTNNGYIFKETARFSPFAFAGIGMTNYRIFVDQYYGSFSGTPYNYANLDGNIRPDISEGNKQMQDGVYETEVTKKNIEETTPKNLALTIPLGLGVNVRFSDRWSAQIAASMLLPNTDRLDGVSGKANPNADPASQEAYLANPSGYLGARTSNTKKDKVYNASLTVGYSFGGNYYDAGPVVQAPKDTTKVRKTQESYEIDPFEESAIATSRGTKKNFTLKEREEVVLFTNSEGKKDTMFVMKMDTVYADAGSSYASNYPKNTTGGYRGTGDNPKNTSGSSPYTLNQPYTSYQAMDPIQSSGADAAVIRDIYLQLQKLNSGLTSIDNRVKQIENTLANGALKGTPMAVAPNPTSVTNTINTVTTDNSSMFDGMQQVVLYFGYGASVLDAATTTKLAAVAAILKQHSNVGVALNAFADPSGSSGLNMRLSQERAASVRKYLVDAGVKGYQVIAQYHGSEEKSGAPDPSKRRVEVEFIKVR